MPSTMPSSPAPPGRSRALPPIAPLSTPGDSTESHHYFRTTPIASQSSSNSTSTSKSAPSKPLTLYFTGKDLPEPDSRSRASYAVLYIAYETPLDDAPATSRLPSLNSTTTTDAQQHISTLTADSQDAAPPRSPRSPRSPRTPRTPRSGRTPRTPRSVRSNALSDARAPAHPPLHLDRLESRAHSRASVRSHELPARAASAPARVPRSSPLLPTPSRASTAPRAPHRAVTNFAPPQPTVHIDRYGTRVRRTAWMKVGTTEVARKQGRDVEFARSFRLDYSPAHRVVVRLAFFDCTSVKVDRQRLIATSEFYLSAVFAANSHPVSFPLKFLPITKNDYRRSARIPNGTLVVVADHIVGASRKYRLDVECNRILRSASLSTATVRRVFYTIHAIVDDNPASDIWTLIFRSESVHMIHSKRDGGSLEYNYFSSRRLKAAPGVILEDQIPTGGQEQDGGMRALVAKALGIRRKDCFFSLPGADLSLNKADRRLKLSLFEDNGLSAGYHLIADTCFSISELRKRELGEASAIKVHANVVGRAQLKYVEISSDPRYFCLALCMQGVR